MEDNALYASPDISLHGTKTRALRGPGPLNSNRLATGAMRALKTVSLISAISVQLLACGHDTFKRVDVLGSLPADHSAVADFSVEFSGFWPRLSIAAVPEGDQSIKGIPESELWPSKISMTFSDQEGTVLKLLGTPWEGSGDRKTSLREAFLWGKLIETRYPERVPESSDGDFSVWDDLLPNGNYTLEVSWNGETPPETIGRYEVAFVDHHNERLLVGLLFSRQYQESVLN